MAQVSDEHLPILASAFVGVLTVSLLLLGALNFIADK